MKITILDGYVENPGDLSWDWLKKFGEVEIFDRTPNELIAERCKGSDILITNKTPLREEILKNLPCLKYIGLLSTGYNVVDWQYCREKGIPVCNIPSYSTDAVAQLTFAHILEHTNSVAAHSNSVHSGEWSACKDFCYWVAPLTELSGKVLGIIGFGKIGKAVAKIALAFGMRVIASTNHPSEFSGVEFVDRDYLIENSDFISLHCPRGAVCQEVFCIFSKVKEFTTNESPKTSCLHISLNACSKGFFAFSDCLQLTINFVRPSCITLEKSCSVI